MTCSCAQTSYLFKFCVESPGNSSCFRSVATFQGHDPAVLCTQHHTGCVQVTLTQAVPVLARAGPLPVHRLSRQYGFTWILASFSGTETATCGSLVRHRWGKHGLVGSVVAGWRRWWVEGFKGKGNAKGKAKEQVSHCVFAAAFHRGVCSVVLMMTVATLRNHRNGLSLLNTLLLEKQMMATETLWLYRGGVHLSSESLAPQAGEIHLNPQTLTSLQPQRSFTQTPRGILPNFLLPRQAFSPESNLKPHWECHWSLFGNRIPLSCCVIDHTLENAALSGNSQIILISWTTCLVKFGTW